MNIGISVGADIAILVISDIGKICADKPIFLNWITFNNLTTPVCHTLKLQCEANSKYTTIMKSIVFVTFVMKEYLGGIKS